MGAVATILPLIIEGVKLIPTLVSAGQKVYDGARLMWEGVTADETPTPDQQAQYDSAMEEAFQALMQSTDDVKE